MHNSAKHNISSNDNKYKISRKTVFLVIGIFIVVLVGYFFISGKLSTGNSISGSAIYSTGDTDYNSIQKINLGFKNNYYPNTITVKAGKPVELTLDGSIRGCYRSFNIPELGISAYSQNPLDTIKFTPGKKGQFEFKCEMGMGRGTIIVE